jgi:hypothetical protein
LRGIGRLIGVGAEGGLSAIHAASVMAIKLTKTASRTRHCPCDTPDQFHVVAHGLYRRFMGRLVSYTAKNDKITRDVI